MKFKDKKGYDEILEVTRNVPRDTDTTGGEENAQIKAANKRGYRDLILATKDTSLTMVANAKMDGLPKGDLHLAWKKLEKRWDPKSREDKIDSLAKFVRLKMENIQMKPQDWIAHMERKRNELENSGHDIDDETFLTHVMASLPQEEYQTTILTLRAKLREDDLTIQEAETLLDDKYEAMKEIQEWTEDGDVLALLVGKPHFKKTFNDNVDTAVSMVTKQLIVEKEKTDLESKKTGQAKFKPNQYRKPIWK